MLTTNPQCDAIVLERIFELRQIRNLETLFVCELLRDTRDACAAKIQTQINADKPFLFLNNIL